MVPLTSTDTLMLAGPSVEMLRDKSCFFSVTIHYKSTLLVDCYLSERIRINERGRVSPWPLLSLRFMGLKWDAIASRFCWSACCMRRCWSSASRMIFFFGPSAVAAPAAARSKRSLRCSSVAAWASCCCPRAAGNLGTTGVRVSSVINKTNKWKKDKPFSWEFTFVQKS